MGAVAAAAVPRPNTFGDVEAPDQKSAIKAAIKAFAVLRAGRKAAQVYAAASNVTAAAQVRIGGAKLNQALVWNVRT
jgi:hypothetical protein